LGNNWPEPKSLRRHVWDRDDRSTDVGQNWEEVNNDLVAHCDTYLRGAFRLTDNAESRIEINHDVIQADVRALAINSSGHIFCRTYFGGGVFLSTDNGGS
jgi:hypothetical protein